MKLFNELHWIHIYDKAQISKYTLTFKLSKQIVTFLPKNCLELNNKLHSRTTRYCNLNLCPVFKSNTEGGRYFAVSTCQLWNALPIPTKKLPTVKTFRNFLRNQLFENQNFSKFFNVIYTPNF